MATREHDNATFICFTLAFLSVNQLLSKLVGRDSSYHVLALCKRYYILVHFLLFLFVMESDEEFGMEFSESESDTSDSDNDSEATTDQESDSSNVSFSNIRVWREIDVTAALPPAPPRFLFTGTPSDFTQNDSSKHSSFSTKYSPLGYFILCMFIFS